MEMKVWFWIRDFQAFETEVQMIMDFKVRKVKIWVRISSGKYPHRIDFLLSDIAPDFREREPTKAGGAKLVLVWSVSGVEEIVWVFES